MNNNNSNSNNNNKFMSRAIALAEEGMTKGAGGPFGAVVVKDGQIIAEAYNVVTSSNDPTAHAEVTAIRRACEVLGSFQLEGYVLYTSCEPCPMCLGAIYWSRLDKIYYAAGQEDAAKVGFDDQFIYDEIDREMGERRIPFERLLPEQGASVFQLWNDKGDKMEY